jgi:hypothetical protein
MKKNAGILTTLAVILAFFGFSNLSKNPSAPPPGTETTSTATRSTRVRAAHSAKPQPPCEEIQSGFSPLSRTRRMRSGKRLTPPGDHADEERGHEINTPDVDFVIATPPHPISTHLSLQFDRMLEIIQKAAQDNGYNYNSSWLPCEGKDYARYPDQLAAEAAQGVEATQPGVLVFRLPNPKGKLYKGGLAVFVVAELPTGGINQEQFQNAVAWITQLGGLPGDRQMKILGPSFSGSLPSLYRSLNSPQLTSLLGKSSKRIRVSSGSVFSDSDIDWFQKRLTDDGLGTFETALAV